MRCDLLRLNILLREDQEKREQPTTSKLYDVYAYCEGDAHQLGQFECLINREDILERFKELLPNISLSSLGRGTSQEVILDKDISLVDALEETTALGKEIFSVMPPIIRESISNSNNIRLFTNDILLPWEIMYNEHGFVSLSNPFGISPVTKRRITPRPRKINERLRILMIVDPLDNLPQARTEMNKISSLLKNDPRVQEPIILVGKKQATWSVVRNYLREESFDILHVAAHTKFDKENDENTGIILSDGFVLHPSEIFYDIKGDPPWLIFLNTCESAKAKDLKYFDKYNELSGLADAFIAAGALSYIGTNGPINDLSASEISIGFYNALLKGSTVAESLKESKVQYFENNQNDLSWSLFRIYGNTTQKIELQEPKDDNESKIKRWLLKTGSRDPLKCAVELDLDINEVMTILSKIYRK